MTDRWGRLAPLTGVLFVLLGIGAIVSNSSESPKASASGLRVLAYYTAHRSDVEASSILFALAFLVVVLFAGALSSYLRHTGGASGLGALVVAGGVLMAAGALTGSGVEYGLAHNIHSITLQEAQTLNFISNEVFLAVLAGGFVLAVCAGIAILRGAALPKWLGWVAIVIGVVTLVPPLSMFALLVFILWTLIVSILMYLRLGKPEQLEATVAPAV